MNGIEFVLVAGTIAAFGALTSVAIPGNAGRFGGFLALLAGGAFACLAGLEGLAFPAPILVGTASLHLTLRLDATAGFFLAVVGVVAVLCGLYGLGGKTADERRSGRTAASTACVILLASILACVAADVLLFIFAWELLALAFFWAIAFAGTHEDAPRAAYFALVITHVAGAALAAALLLLARASGGFDVAAVVRAAAHVSAAERSGVFVLLLVGFGAKFGMLPMQAWLRYGYRSAPSVVAALMAGGALNVGFYGVARFVVPLGGDAPHWAPILLLGLGALGAAYGIAMATGERDLPSLAAYSSVENAGIILAAFGVALCGRVVGNPTLYGLGIAAAFLHIVAHALAKSTLFLTTSSIMERCKTTSFELLGGLARRMPITTIAGLTASLSLAALPPVAGFCSEWLVLESMMQAFRTNDPVLETALAICGALIGLAAGIAIVAFVKVVGVAMLGAPRSAGARDATELRSVVKLTALLLSSMALVLAGAMAPQLVALFEPAVRAFDGSNGASAIVAVPGLVQPAFGGFSSISPLGLPLVIVGLTLGFWLLTRLIARPRPRVSETWTSGEPYRAWTQYTGTGFANPTRVILDGLTRTIRNLNADTYESRSKPLFDIGWYARIGGAFERVAKLVTATQSGVIAHYLTYILAFAILLLLLLPSIRHW